MKKKILVTGSMAYDDIMDFPGLFKDNFRPDKLHQINISFLVESLDKHLGGIGTNISYNAHLLARKGIPVELYGAVGKDGDEFLRWMKLIGLDTRHVIVDQNMFTSTGKVITDKADNQIWGFYMGTDAAAGLTIDYKSGDVLMLSATHPKAFLNFQQQAIEIKMDYMYDPGMTLSWIKKKALKEGVLAAKWLIGNDYEIARVMEMTGLTIDGKNGLAAKGVVVITTLGAEGVTYRDGNNEIYVSAYGIKNPIDPTGAGDAFRGGFLAAYMNGENTEECLKLAGATASFAVEKLGTVTHNPSVDDIKKRARTLKVRTKNY